MQEPEELTVHGTCDPRFAAVREAFVGNFRERGEVGAALYVYLDGEPVVDLWAGLADAEAGRPWERDTLANVYSVTKPFAALAAALLWDRGQLALDDPVTRWWPEFGQGGKEAATVRHVLTHQAGVLAVREPQPPEVLLDWERMVAVLAAEPAWWPPGERFGEHALFYGHLVGELVRRIDGRTLGTFLREEVAEPWGLDWHVGLRPDEQGRVARHVDPGGAFRRSVLDDPRRLVGPSLDNPPGALDVDVVNGSAWRAAEVPAVNGHATAHAIARLYAGLAAGGELDGVRLLRPETVAEVTRPQVTGRDVLMEDERSWGLGPAVFDGDFGLGGIGGFSGWGSTARGVGFGYVTGLLAGFSRGDAAEDAVEAALAELGR